MSENDQWHAWSRRTLTVLDEDLATTETALAEARHRLRRYRDALQEIISLLAVGRLRRVPILAERPRRVGELLAKYPEMDAGEATLVELSEQLQRAKLIAVDDDFRIYRRFRNQAKALISPGKEQSWTN